MGIYHTQSQNCILRNLLLPLYEGNKAKNQLAMENKSRFSKNFLTWKVQTGYKKI